MKKGKTEKGRGEIAVTKESRVSTHEIRTVAIILTVLLAMIALMSFYVRNERRIAELNRVEITENTERLAHDWDAFLKTRQEIMGHLSRYYSMNLAAADDIHRDLLQRMAKDSCFDYIEYAAADGWSYNTVGARTNVADHSGYINGMEGKSGAEVLFDFHGTNENILVVYAPVHYDGAVIGVLMGGVRTSGRIAQLLDVSLYSNETEIYLCDPDGNIYAVSQADTAAEVKHKTNAVDYFKDESFTDMVKSTVTDGENHSFAAQSKGDGIGCTMRTPRSGWIIVSLYPSEAHDTVVYESSKLAYQMIAIAVVLYLILAVTLLFISRVDHKAAIEAEKKQKDELADRVRIITEQLSILHALSRDMLDIYILDLDEGTSTVLKANGKFKENPKQLARSYTETWQAFADNFVVEEDRETALQQGSLETVCRELEEKEEYSYTFRIKAPTGERYALAKFTRLSEGENKFLMGFYNIDAQVRSEVRQKAALQDALDAAKAANRAKTAFLNNVSHDIRTPMNAITGFSALAEKHLGNEERVRDYLGKIQVAGNHLLSLINDILDMSRIESGKTHLEERETNLQELLQELCTIVQPDIKARQLDFYMDAADVVNENVICDKLRLSRVLLNLLSNAMKFTKPGGFVAVHMRQKPCDAAGYADFTFAVKDNGIGMSKEFQKHVFEAFERERTSTESGIQGTGLGMSICKNIVDMMGGTITVESETGVGTEFTVNLRMKISGDAVVQTAIPEFDGARALVVDNDFDTCASITGMMTSIGLRADWTTSGKEAGLRAQMASEQDDAYQVYLIDRLMPDMNGVEVVRRIRRLIGDDKPVIIISAYDWADIEQEAREAGVTGFISKPLFLSDLRRILLEAIGKGEEKKTAEETAREASFEGKRILLVDDNILNREIAEEILTEFKFCVETVPDGAAAVEKMQNATPGQYDLILMDIQMPRMNGYDATRAIRALPDPAIADIPIIAMTANAFDEDKKKALEAGMDAHVAKPIDIPTLIKTISEILEKRD